jgi:hypothetical protein
MKKVIRLTESDLIRMVKSVLIEQSEKSVIIYNDVTEKKINNSVIITGTPKKVGTSPTIEVSAQIVGSPERKGKLEVHCDGEYRKFYFYETTQGKGLSVTVNGYNKKASDSFCSVYKTATKVGGESCLIQGGFKKTMVGGPMTKSEMYVKSINGKTHQLDVDGYARIVEKDGTESIGKWVCDMSSPHKVKFLNLKSKPIMPM